LGGLCFCGRSIIVTGCTLAMQIADLVSR